MVEALLCRKVHELLAHSQVPLAHNGGAVTYCLQTLCYCGFVQRETCREEERGGEGVKDRFCSY